jgi:hypothetical protein
VHPVQVLVLWDGEALPAETHPDNTPLSSLLWFDSPAPGGGLAPGAVEVVVRPKLCAAPCAGVVSFRFEVWDAAMPEFVHPLPAVLPPPLVLSGHAASLTPY